MPRGCQQMFYASVAEALTQGGAGPNTIDQALMAQAVIDAACRSSGEGRVVTL